MDGHRSERVAEAIREELGEIINYELADPRIGPLTVTEVHVDRDLRKAQVRIALGGDVRQQKETLAALAGARHYIRRILANRLELYRVPDLHFESDLSPELVARVDSLLKRMHKGRPRETGPSNSSSETEKDPLK
jgi:ribosome-binding factor A